MKNQITQRAVLLISVAALVGLAACERRQASPASLVEQCQAEVAPPGTYVYEDEATLPVVTPVEDGTEAGAHAFNACIREKAAQAGLIANPLTGRSNSLCPDGAPTILGGATYCIGTN